MITRRSPKSGPDDFPTPPWATRALLYYVLPTGDKKGTAWEPACGRGYMADVLSKTFKTVRRTDIIDYGRNDILDFVGNDAGPVDWVITNPPYKLAEEFFHTAMVKARVGVALLVRINWLQNGGRFKRIFKAHPPRTVAIFSERMSATQGRVIRKSPVFFQHCWVVWYADDGPSVYTKLQWIPPEAQKLLEQDSDYA